LVVVVYASLAGEAGEFILFPRSRRRRSRVAHFCLDSIVDPGCSLGKRNFLRVAEKNGAQFKLQVHTCRISAPEQMKFLSMCKLEARESGFRIMPERSESPFCVVWACKGSDNISETRIPPKVDIHT
jgi:hypothetical protein